MKCLQNFQWMIVLLSVILAIEAGAKNGIFLLMKKQRVYEETFKEKNIRNNMADEDAI